MDRNERLHRPIPKLPFSLSPVPFLRAASERDSPRRYFRRYYFRGEHPNRTEDEGVPRLAATRPAIAGANPLL